MLGGQHTAGSAVSLLGRRAVRSLGRILLQLGRPKDPPPWRRLWAEMQVGIALLGGTYALLYALGGSRGALYPLIYAVCAFLVSFHRRPIAVSLSALALLGDVLLLYLEGEREPWTYLAHSGLMAGFATLHFVLFRSELWRQRGDHRRRIADAIAGLQQQARDFRLLLADDSVRREGTALETSLTPGSGLLAGAGALPSTGGPWPHDRAKEEELLARGAVVELQQNLHAMVELLKNALHLHTCALFFMPSSGTELKMVAFATSSPRFYAGSLHPDAGVVGTVVKSREIIKLMQPKAGQLPYYSAGADLSEMTAFLGIPLLEDGKLYGVLCADRITDPARPNPEGFNGAEQTLLSDAALLIQRSLQCERLFIAVERSKYEHERLYRASTRLARALTPEEVHRTSLAALAEVCTFDFAALTLFDAEKNFHSVVAAEGDSTLVASVLNTRFPDNAGFVAMAVKNRTALPAGGELRDLYTPIFDADVRLRGYASLLVVPLSYGGAAGGTLVVGAKRAKGFSPSKIDMLGVLANQIAVSLENARMYRAMEAMATTDGLTGLRTRRVFQERLDDMLRRAERHTGPVTLIISDIDHFKKINDTYGHLVGDKVLRRVAQVVQSSARTIDVAARYGGEEFVVVLDGTDLPGGRLFAERVRQEVQKLILQSDKGAFSCTLSLGVATFPDDATEGKLLIEYADQALYYAKRQGRNQSIAYRDIAPVSNAA